MAGLTDDEANRWSYLAEGNAKQARKRTAADVVIRDQASRILLVNPTYKEYWDMPGGMVEANEPPRAAAERELREELGLSITVGRLLTLDWVAPYGPWDDQLVFVFDAGTLLEDQAAQLRITDDELSAFEFVSAARCKERLREDVASRLERALRALDTTDTEYSELG